MRTGIAEEDCSEDILFRRLGSVYMTSAVSWKVILDDGSPWR